MAGGYGMRDGTVLVNAISDYANYVENKRRYDAEAERQRQLDAEEKRRYAAQQERLARLDAQDISRYETEQERLTRLDAIVKEKHDLAIRREQIAIDEHAASKAAKQGIVDANLADMDAQQAESARVKALQDERTQMVGQELANKVMSRGASGNGIRIQYDQDPNDPNAYLAKNVDAEGNVKQLTWDPFDDNSAPIRINKADAATLEKHVENAVQGAENLPPEYQAAYGRSAIAPNKDGTARPATAEEFPSFLQRWMTGAAARAKDITSPGGGARAVGRIVDDAVDNTKYVAAMATAPMRAIKTWWSGSSEDTKGTVKVTDDGVKVKPSKAHDVEAVKKAKAEIDASGVELPTLLNNEPDPLLRVKAIDEELANIDARYSSKRKKAESYGQLYINGGLTTAQYENVMATGNVNVSPMDKAKFEQDTKLDFARSQKYLADAQKAIVDMQAKAREAGKDARKTQFTENKQFMEVTSTIGEEVAAASFPNMKKEFRDAKAQQLTDTLRKTMTVMALDNIDVNSRFGIVTVSSAMQRMARDGSDNMPETLTPYLVSEMSGIRANSDLDVELRDTLRTLGQGTGDNPGWSEGEQAEIATVLISAGYSGQELVDRLKNFAATGRSAADIRAAITQASKGS